MADNSTIIKVAAVGAAAYVAYTQGWLSFLGIAAPTSAATAPAAAANTPVATAPTGAVVPSPAPVAAPTVPNKANVLDGIYGRMVAAANAPSQGLGVDAWGYYLNQQLAPLGLIAPDPVPIFSAYAGAPSPGAPSFDRSTFLTTAPTYWQLMAPALQSQLGLSGLGVIGGLGMYWRTN